MGDEDDAMETGEEKDESKSPSKSVDTAALSPDPSKFDEPRSPVLSDPPAVATESSSKADDISSNDKMDSDESKEKPEGDENSMTTGGKGIEEGSPIRRKSNEQSTKQISSEKSMCLIDIHL